MFTIKAAGRAGCADSPGLRALREHLGDAFVAGIALYAGVRSHIYDDRLHVMPTDCLRVP